MASPQTRNTTPTAQPQPKVPQVTVSFDLGKETLPTRPSLAKKWEWYLPAASYLLCAALTVPMIRWLIDQKRPARPAAITPSDCPRDIETALNDLLRPRPGNSEFLHCYLFRYLAAARPLENESDMSREQWIRSAADLYDGVQRRLWYFRSLLDDKPTDVYPFEKLSEKERVDRFIEVLKAEDLNPRYSAIRQKRPMAFDKHPGLPADWPDIALVMIYLDIKEIWQTMDDWRVKQRRPNSLKRLVGS